LLTGYLRDLKSTEPIIFNLRSSPYPKIYPDSKQKLVDPESSGSVLRPNSILTERPAKNGKKKKKEKKCPVIEGVSTIRRMTNGIGTLLRAKARPYFTSFTVVTSRPANKAILD
jgi:hypothetical protein